MKILITGSTSIHGWPVYQRLCNCLPMHDICAVCPPRTSVQGIVSTPLCLADRESLLSLRSRFKPTHIIHAGGSCDLDACEDDPERAHKLNVESATNLAAVFGENCYYLYLSADLVFSGNNPPQTGYTENHLPDPVSVVGKTFVEAEKVFKILPKSCVVRLGLPMGSSVDGHKGAVDFIEGRLSRNLPMSLFHDEHRSCIDCNDMADFVVEMLLREATGMYHLGGSQATSLYAIGEAILRRGGYDPKYLKRWSRHDEIGGPPRIGNVHLDSRKIELFLGRATPAWQLGTEGYWYRGVRK